MRKQNCKKTFLIIWKRLNGDNGIVTVDAADQRKAIDTFKHSIPGVCRVTIVQIVGSVDNYVVD